MSNKGSLTLNDVLLMIALRPSSLTARVIVVWVGSPSIFVNFWCLNFDCFTFVVTISLKIDTSGVGIYNFDTFGIEI